MHGKMESVKLCCVITLVSFNPGGGGGYSKFQVTGMIEGFLGFEILRFWDLFGYTPCDVGKFGEYFFGWLDLRLPYTFRGDSCF